MENILIYYLIGVGVFVFFCLLILASKVDQLHKYEKICLGMPEYEMLKIMGKGYNKSLLQNGRVKYEWRMNSSSYGRGGARTYSGVKKVDIYCTNGLVDEVKPYNV